MLLQESMKHHGTKRIHQFFASITIPEPILGTGAPSQVPHPRALISKRCELRAAGVRAAERSWTQNNSKTEAQRESGYNWQYSLLSGCSFGGSLVRNARFADLTHSLVRSARFADLTHECWRKSRSKRSFCRLDAAIVFH